MERYNPDTRQMHGPFEKFQLRDIHWKDTLPYTLQKKAERLDPYFDEQTNDYSNQYFHQNFIINNDQLDFFGLRKVFKKKDLQILLRICNNDSFIHLKIELNKYTDNYCVITAIKKERGSATLPSKLGIQLYEKLFDFLQDLADTTGKPVTHIVRRAPEEMSDTPLTIERWNQIFFPILNKNGRVYTLDPETEHTFEHTFLPESKKPNTLQAA
ncbi:MAG: hypothetical protein HYV32_06110 [Candidatus Kerfeldbacteria bacterium]|nr:hypothetical protein [Candidatus Kerfeldbacteria bacterium]